MRCLVVTSLSTEFNRYAYYQDWQESFVHHPQLNTTVLDIQNIRTTQRGLLLFGRHDLIVFLHNVFPSLSNSPRLRILKWLLKKVSGPRVFFLANEFRSLQTKAEMAAYLGATTLVSQLNKEDAELLYSNFWSGQIFNLPYGFDPTLFKPTMPTTQREIHIGFRGDYYPAYVGHDDRDLLLDDFNQRIQEDTRLNTDIQVGERLERLEWASFLNSCRSIIGHEAGSTRLDADENIRFFLNAQYKRLTPENFRQLVVAMRDTGVFDPPPSGRIAAPRNFEAMGTKTLQILLPGRYNDMLHPGIHYVELQRDFSNLDVVIDTLFDDAAVEKIVEHAYADALEHHTYKSRIDTLLNQVL